MSAPADPPLVAAPTLRQRLLLHVLLPVLLVWLTSTAVVIEIAYVYTQRAFDRALVDDAYALSAHVRQTREGLSLELSARELDSVLFDQSERVYFAIIGLDGRVLANNAPWLVTDLLASRPDASVPPPDTSVPYVLSDRHHEGVPLRTVELLLSEGRVWRVMVAQTVRARTTLVQQMLLYAVVPAVLLFMLLGFWLRRAIGTDLAPLNRLRAALQARDASDLSAVPVDASSRDVAQVAQAVNALFDRIGAGVSAQREFAGNVAHELRNPLAGIRALAEYGLRHDDGDTRQQQLTAILERQAHASHLIDQLLALAFADEARDTLALTAVDLGTVVERAVLAALPRMDANHAEVNVQGLDGAVVVHGNEGVLTAMLGNLLDNAARHARPASGEALAVTVLVSAGEARETGEAGEGLHAVTLAVEDNGQGLAAAQLEARRRWSRGSGVEGARGSTGLGLAIVARYAELLGSRLLLENRPQGGLRASVRLRRAPTELPPVPYAGDEAPTKWRTRSRPAAAP